MCCWLTCLVYSDSTDHSYNHHEIMLNTYPLCLEWMDYDIAEPDKKGMQCTLRAYNVIKLTVFTL